MVLMTSRIGMQDSVFLMVQICILGEFLVILLGTHIEDESQYFNRPRFWSAQHLEFSSSDERESHKHPQPRSWYRPTTSQT